MSIVTRLYQCTVCPVRTTFTDEHAEVERLAAKLGWCFSTGGLRCCSRGCFEQARRDSLNEVVSLDGHEVERRQALARAATAAAPTTTTARAQAEAKAREISVVLTCVRCRSRTELVAMLDGEGKVVPSPMETARTLGFVELPGGGLACSKFCRDVLALEAKRGVAIAPVLALSDAATRRRVQRPAAATAATDGDPKLAAHTERRDRS